MELSIVIPCLNEEETLGTCLKKAITTLNKNNVKYEIIVADNGSQDNSIQIASKFENVKVINVQEKGYGIAIRTGISQANGKYILMADADDSYDFNDVMKFLNKIREGYQLVQGCRFPSGGGKLKKEQCHFLTEFLEIHFLVKLQELFMVSPLKTFIVVCDVLKEIFF